MRVPRINRKLILCAVLALAIIGTFLVPSASVTAATQAWPLTLVGASTVTITQAQFEAMAVAHPASYTENATATWTGVALWRLIALVDDLDPATFNDALANVYSIKMTAGDNYTKTVLPSDNMSFARNENLIVANTLNGAPLPMTDPWKGKALYPLKVTGTGTTASSQKVGALVQIELLNLPVTTVSVSPASQAVANGASFTVDLAINTNQQSRGWQANVSFDATKMQCTGVTEGGFLKDYATANGGGTIPAGAPTENNTSGVVTIPGYAITGAGTGGPTGTGTLCTLSFTAKASADNFASITPSGVVVSNALGVAIPGVAAIGGTVAIGNVPMPDLVVTALSATKDGDGTYAIAYTITNQGNDPAGACSTSIVVDNGTPILAACPALAAGASDNVAVFGLPFGSPSDKIVVTADSAGAVSESNELNNTREISYALASDGGNVIVNGNILATLDLTVPADIASWVLQPGSNTTSGTANVKCNTPWQLQVNDQDGNTDGHMTKWNGSYDTSVKLASPLYVGAVGPYVGVALSGSNQTIDTGDTSGQNLDNGQDLTIQFSQPVAYSDPVLTGGYSYHIVVTFTASGTF